MELNKRPTRAIVNLSHLRYNLKQLQAIVPEGKDIMAIVKANAYGHGATFCARTLESCGVKKLGVATFEEGIELRKQGIRSEIYVLDGLMAHPSEYFSNRLYPVTYEMAHLQVLSDFLNTESREFSICIKFDTGMGRLGFVPSQVDDVVNIIKKTPQFANITFMTHLAKADLADQPETKRQYTLFKKLKDILVERGVSGANYSICNSAALIDGLTDEYDWVRPGIALYGCYPNERQQSAISLKPVLELKTKIFSLKEVGPHTSIGYGATYQTERDTKLAILPIGYADGYPRLVSNRGAVLVRGVRAPIVGRISMDLMAVDVTDVPNVKLHDDVTLIGTEGDQCIRAEEVADWAETISYEILCGLTARVPREYEGL